MVVDQIDIKNVTILEPKNNSPIAGYIHGVKAVQPARQTVKTISRPSHMLDRICGIEVRQNDFDFLKVVLIYLTSVSSFIQPL